MYKRLSHDGRVLSFCAGHSVVTVGFVPKPQPPACPTCGHAESGQRLGTLTFTYNGFEQTLHGPVAGALYDLLCDMVGR